MATHDFPEDQVHFTWDAGNEPVITIADGDTVVFETRDVSDNQIGPDSDSSVIEGLNWDRVYPLAGPSRRGRAAGRHARRRDPRHAHARLGLDGDPAGLGLLADDFTEAYLRIFDCSPGDPRCSARTWRSR